MQGTVARLKDTRHTQEFIVETTRAVDADTLLCAFKNVRQIEKETLIFSGGETEMFEVLKFITEHRLPVSKIERIEPSLESLFMEVTGK